MNVIRKDATISNTGSDGEFPGTFEVVLSTPAEDRDGDELKSEDWEQPLPDHITFDQDHGMSVATTVGSGTPRIDDGGRLVVDGTYSSLPRAQDVRTLVNEGHIRTTSVAFMTKKVTKGGQQRTVRELLNGAFVAIPSNREAVVVDSKSIGTLVVDAKEVARLVIEQLNVDGKTIAGSTVAVKSVDGSYEQRQQAICDALEALYPDPPANGYIYAWPLATFDDKVVYRVGGDTDLRGQWQADYTVNDDGTIELGEPQQVQMVEVVKPIDGAAPKGYRLTAAPKNFDLDEAEAPHDQDEQAKSAADSAAATTKAAAADSAADDTATLDLKLRGLLTTVSAHAGA